jgi:hypothetical protein
MMNIIYSFKLDYTILFLKITKIFDNYLLKLHVNLLKN